MTNIGCISYFCTALAKKPREQLKGGMIYLGPHFQSFQFIVLGSIDSEPIMRQNTIMAGAHGRGNYSSHGR
jgi:hypothetical protein